MTATFNDPEVTFNDPEVTFNGTRVTPHPGAYVGRRGTFFGVNRRRVKSANPSRGGRISGPIINFLRRSMATGPTTVEGE